MEVTDLNDFEQKFQLLKSDIARFNKKIEIMAEQDRKSGCRLAFVTAMPWGLYVFYFPLFWATYFNDSKWMDMLLNAFLFFPVLCSGIVLLCACLSVKERQIKMNLLFRRQLRNRTMQILYPMYRYEYGDFPGVLKNLRSAGILPDGKDTYMGQLRNENIQLYELSIDRVSTKKESYFNVFHGIVCIWKDYDKSVFDDLRGSVQGLCKIESFGEWNSKFVFLLTDLSFDQFMHHRYSRSKWSQGNPFAFRKLTYGEMEKNYQILNKIIQILEGTK